MIVMIQFENYYHPIGIYKTISPPVVLYGWVSRSLILGEELTSQAYENKVPGWIKSILKLISHLSMNTVNGIPTSLSPRGL
jgi:hypothetical protein